MRAGIGGGPTGFPQNRLMIFMKIFVGVLLRQGCAGRMFHNEFAIILL
jgi:hypothetical protein